MEVQETGARATAATGTEGRGEIAIRPDLYLLSDRPDSALICDRAADVTDANSVTKTAVGLRGTGRACRAAAAGRPRSVGR